MKVAPGSQERSAKRQQHESHRRENLIALQEKPQGERHQRGKEIGKKNRRDRRQDGHAARGLAACDKDEKDLVGKRGGGEKEYSHRPPTEAGNPVDKDQ